MFDLLRSRGLAAGNGGKFHSPPTFVGLQRGTTVGGSRSLNQICVSHLNADDNPVPDYIEARRWKRRRVSSLARVRGDNRGTTVAVSRSLNSYGWRLRLRYG